MLLKARFVRKNGMYTECTVSGHDAAEEDAEYSVLCAAVSSAMQLVCNTLTECFCVPEDAVQVQAASGAQNQITIRLSSPDKVQSEILHGLLLHFSLLSEDAGNRMQVTVTEA